MKDRGFETGPKRLHPNSEATHLIRQLLAETIVRNNFDQDGRFTLVRPQDLASRFYMFCPDLLGRSDGNNVIRTTRSGLLEVMEAEKGLQSIPPDRLRFSIVTKKSRLGESGFLLRCGVVIRGNESNFCFGILDSQGNQIDKTPEEVDEQVKRAMEGKKPHLFSRLPFIQVTPGYPEEEFELIELTHLNSTKTTDQVVLDKQYHLVPIQISYPLHPEKWLKSS